MIKLNLGCGRRHKKGYINIDIQEPCDLLHDLTTPLPFKDNSVDEVFTEDFIRLISREEWRRLKKEISRVLKINGKLHIIAIDLRYILKSFLSNKDGRQWDWWIKTIYPQDNKYNFAKNGFTYHKLVADLFIEGFANFRKGPVASPEFINVSCYKRPFAQKPERKMTVLIGTPIHQKNDPLIQRWIKNVSELENPTDLLLVDTSPDLNYLKKIQYYCSKFRIRKHEIQHLNIRQENGMDEMIGESREVMRRYVLSKNYDALFAWNCDQKVEPDAITKFASLAEAGNLELVHRKFSEPLSCTLIRRPLLVRFGFLLKYPHMPDCWHNSGEHFKRAVIEDGANYMEI